MTRETRTRPTPTSLRSGSHATTQTWGKTWTKTWTCRAVTVALALAVMATLAPVASAEHVERRQAERLAGLAHDLEEAAHDAYYLTHRYGHGPVARDLLRDFRSLERAANRFHEEAHYARAPYEARRELHRLAERYYEVRYTFRRFHGSSHVRQAFHRINRPMEVLYRFYTGRDLYRDDPYARRAHRTERPRTRGRDHEGHAGLDRGRHLGHRDADDGRLDRRDRGNRRGRRGGPGR